MIHSFFKNIDAKRAVDARIWTRLADSVFHAVNHSSTAPPRKYVCVALKYEDAIMQKILLTYMV